mmetsp:Transcript_83096/g.161749  ORF Transcript_83096/g.161749 Transcript_83096/m.161749 type:complete len:134 (+) Transcript_83096:265-666(+)
MLPCGPSVTTRVTPRASNTREWCAITSTVRRCERKGLSFAITSRSVRASRAEVNSSKSTTGGSLSKSRAMATRCRSPPLSCTPPSPTSVSSPSPLADPLHSKGPSPAASAAAITSASVTARSSPPPSPPLLSS